MGIEQTLLKEIEESQRQLNGRNDDIIYRRDQPLRIELIKWVLEELKSPDVQICTVLESKINK